MGQNNILTGKLGEQIAQNYLEKKGYKIIAQNYHTRFGEIDLIARQGEKLIFIEVKTRHGTNFGLPEQAINYFKCKKMVHTAKSYVWKHQVEFEEIQFDSISIYLDAFNHKAKLQHFQNIFS